MTRFRKVLSSIIGANLDNLLISCTLLSFLIFQDNSCYHMSCLCISFTADKKMSIFHFLLRLADKLYYRCITPSLESMLVFTVPESFCS